MGMTVEQRSFLRQTWESHEAGNTKAMARQVENQRRKEMHLHDNLLATQSPVPEENSEGNSQKNPEFLAELAHMSVVLNRAAAYLHPALVQAFPYIATASTVALETYPLAASQTVAQEKAEQWQGVYGQKPNAVAETLRSASNILHTVQVLAQATPAGQPDGKQASLARLQTDLTQNILFHAHEGFALSQVNPEMDLAAYRGSWLFAIEQAPYADAEQIMQAFRQHFGRESQRFNAPAVATIEARWFARTLKEKGVTQWKDSLGNLLPTLNTYTMLWKLAGKNVVAGLFGKARREQQWQRQLSHSQPNTYDLDSLIDPWTKIQVGRGATAAVVGATSDLR